MRLHGPGWALDALAYLDAARAASVSAYLERSRSGDGGQGPGVQGTLELKREALSRTRRTGKWPEVSASDRRDRQGRDAQVSHPTGTG